MCRAPRGTFCFLSLVRGTRYAAPSTDSLSDLESKRIIDLKLARPTKIPGGGGCATALSARAVTDLCRRGEVSS